MPKLSEGLVETGTLNIGGEAVKVGNYGHHRYHTGITSELRIEAVGVKIAESLGTLASYSHAFLLHQAVKSAIKAGNKPVAESKANRADRMITFTKIGPVIVGAEIPKAHSEFEPPIPPKIVSIGPFGLKSALGIKKN